MNNKGLLRMSGTILFLLFVTFMVVERASAGNIIFEKPAYEDGVGNWHIVGTATQHPNEALKVFIIRGNQPEAEITAAIQNKQTDAKGNINVQVKGQIQKGDIIIVKIGNQEGRTWAMGIPVGGYSFSVQDEKSGSLALYIGVTAGILAAPIAAQIYIKRRIRRN